MITRVPGCSDMPSGSVTRRILRGSPSGSISTAATTGWPDSTRPSLPVKQTCLAFASCPFRQNLVQGEIDQLRRLGLRLPASGQPWAGPWRILLRRFRCGLLFLGNRIRTCPNDGERANQCKCKCVGGRTGRRKHGPLEHGRSSCLPFPTAARGPDRTVAPRWGLCRHQIRQQRDAKNRANRRNFA